MGKLATSTGNATIRLGDGSLQKIIVGQAVTLTDAEYAALDTATKALLPSPTTVTDPVRQVTVPKALSLPTCTTALRPAPSVAGVGACVYDVTLGLPIFSNGAAWRNAAGTAV